MGNEKPGLDGQGSLGRATVHGVLWMTAGRVLKAPLNLVTIAVLARLLTPSDFGVVAIAVVVMGLATLLVDGSSGMVLIQRAEVTPSLVGASLLLSAVLASLFAVGIIAAGPLIEGQFDFQNMSEILIPFALILPISAAMAISTALLQRGSQFGVLAINSFVAQAAYGIIAIALAFAGFGLWSLVWSQIASVCIETLLCWRAARALSDRIQPQRHRRCAPIRRDVHGDEASELGGRQRRPDRRRQIARGVGAPLLFACLIPDADAESIARHGCDARSVLDIFADAG
ncbi:oligosaccharide flippase family protein [Sphingomonas piscis]|uniref:Oligosaccharide flippase family protein n=1 Tax=Sphingomonas piscis TaxID=2714943 RepID=A0A6G7YRA6_9SPHN|nr:oligosaccharide flippase family protein [Sphingomonas piscis]